MALKSWQTNKKNNAPQKKGQDKEKPAAKKPADEKQAQRAEPYPEPATPPEAMMPTLVMTEPAKPHASEELASEIYEPADTDVATASTPDLPAEEVEIEPVAPDGDHTALANELEAEVTTTEPAPAAQTAPAESTPAQSEPAAGEPDAETEMRAVAPEETQAAEVMAAPSETHAAEPAPVEPAPTEHAPIGEATVATEQPATAPEPTANVSAEDDPRPASEKTLPRERDPRLPPPGTVLQRRVRPGNVRCECTVEQDGIRYAGKLYKSLSAAAIAATKDMGLKSKTQNGHTFWGVAKPARPVRDTLDSLERAWERYRQHAEAAAAQSGMDTGARTRVRQTIEKHAETLSGLHARVA